MLWVLLLPLLPAVLAVDWAQRCTQVSSITGHLQYVDRATYEVVLPTVIKSDIALGETLCFRLDSKSNDTDAMLNILSKSQTKTLYSLKLTKVEQLHNQTNNYQLVIPKPTRHKCLCDCPCFADKELHSQNYCHGQPEPCIQIFKDDQTDKNCIASFLCGDRNADTLCSFYIERDSSFPIYDAIAVATSNSWAYFELNAYNQNTGETMAKTRSLIYNLSEGSKLIIQKENGVNGKMSVTSSGIPNIIPAGWYFKESSSSDLYTGIEVNSLNDWSLNKLGWFKWKNGRTEFPGNLKTEIRSRFSYSFSSCGYDRYSWDFSGRYTNKDFSQVNKSLVKDRYSNLLTSVTAGEQKITANLKTSPRLNIDLQFKETADTIFFMDNSHLESFTAVLQVDKFSNNFLNFSLVGAAGSLVGFVQHESLLKDFSFSVYVDSVKPVKAIAYTALPGFVKCDETIQYKVCLRTYDQKTPTCVSASSHCEKPQDFVVPEWNATQDEGATVGSAGVWDSIANFFNHLNPLKWIGALNENISDLLGWLGMIGDIIIIVIVAIVIWKIRQKCFPNACSCKRKTDHNQGVAVTSGIESGHAKVIANIYELDEKRDETFS